MQLLQTDSLACIRATPKMWSCTYICTSPSYVTRKAVVWHWSLTKNYSNTNQKSHDMTLQCTCFICSCVQRWRSRDVDWDRAIFSASQCGTPLGGRSRYTCHNLHACNWSTLAQAVMCVTCLHAKVNGLAIVISVVQTFMHYRRCTDRQPA